MYINFGVITYLVNALSIGKELAVGTKYLRDDSSYHYLYKTNLTMPWWMLGLPTASNAQGAQTKDLFS